MSGIALFDVAVVLGLVLRGILWAGLRGGALTHARPVHLRCPRTGADTDCSLVQDVRVGQYRDVVYCSAFEDPSEVTCEQECRHLLNLGHAPDRLHVA